LLRDVQSTRPHGLWSRRTGELLLLQTVSQAENREDSTKLINKKKIQGNLMQHRLKIF
jgi:hypothetical protein